MGKPMTRQSESQSGKKFKRQNDKQKMLKKSFPNKVSSFTYIDSERIFGEKERKGGNTSVTRLGDLLDFGQLFKAFGNN